VTGADVRAFKDALLLMPVSMTKRYPGKTLPEVVAQTQHDDTIDRVAPATIGKYLNALKSVFAWAVSNSYIPSNPAAGITVSRKGGKTRLSFDADDLAKLFGTPIFTANERPRGAGGEAAKWLPLLGLFTGARLEELGQSLASDIRQQDGIWYIDINELDEGKSLKTQGSRRQIPLHPNLIRCGFLRYVAQCQGGPLFPLLKPDQYGKITGNWSKWFNRYKRDVGVVIPPKAMKDFHSFRHGFKGACRDARIEEEVHDALTGHSSSKVGRRYDGARGVSLDVKAEAIARITLPIDLSWLYVE
jgi:integrase